MTEVQTGRGRSAIARNLAAVRQRLRRIRVPDAAAPAGSRGRVVLAGAVVAVALIVLFVLTIDHHSVAWWDGLSKSERRAFDVVTQFGKSGWLLVPTGVFCVALLFADWTRTGRRVAAAWIEVGESHRLSSSSPSPSPGSSPNLIKWTVGRSRPDSFRRRWRPSPSTSLSFDYAHVSFPSGHATTAAAAFVAIALIFRGRWILITVVGVAAAAIAVSRVGVRAHFPSDVVGRPLRRQRLHLPLCPCARPARRRLPAPAGWNASMRRRWRCGGCSRSGAAAGTLLRGLRAAWFRQAGRVIAAVEKR